MKRDTLFFRFFKELPECFFRLVGRPENDAQRYKLDAIEFKESAVRLDGVFQPRQPDVDPAYLWEAQFYESDKVYANMMSKVGRFLEHGNPTQDWIAVVIYPTRSMEQKNLHPYRWLVGSDQFVRIYLDELPPASPQGLAMGVLELIAAKPETAMAKAQAMVPHVRESQTPQSYQRLVIQFIETVIAHQFPHLSREEIEKMLKVHDFRQTRVFREAREEGRNEGIEIGAEKAIESVARRLIELKRPLEEIVTATGLTAAQVRKLKKKQQTGG